MASRAPSKPTSPFTVTDNIYRNPQPIVDTMESDASSHSILRGTDMMDVDTYQEPHASVDDFTLSTLMNPMVISPGQPSPLLEQTTRAAALSEFTPSGPACFQVGFLSLLGTPTAEEAISREITMSDAYKKARRRRRRRSNNRGRTGTGKPSARGKLVGLTAKTQANTSSRNNYKAVLPSHHTTPGKRNLPAVRGTGIGPASGKIIKSGAANKKRSTDGKAVPRR